MEIKKLINPLALSDRIVWWSFFVIAPFINILSFVLILWKILPLRSSRDAFALHYNVYFGIDSIGSWYQMFFLSALALIFTIINLIIASVSYNASRTLAYFAIGITLFLQVLVFAATIFTVLLNL
jgi:hypothetical protein